MISLVRGRNTPAANRTTGSIWYPHFSGSLAARRLGMMIPKLMMISSSTMATATMNRICSHHMESRYHGTLDAPSYHPAMGLKIWMRLISPLTSTGSMTAPVIIPIRWVVI